MHIPIYAYRDAWKAAFRADLNPNEITPEMSVNGDCWNDGYKDSFGVLHEAFGTYPEDEGMFDVIKECGHTKYLIAGHDHVDNFSIGYQGVRFIYSLKAGAGCYWDKALSGGTVIEIDDNGIASHRHEYVAIK